jgi:hypothetical protein
LGSFEQLDSRFESQSNSVQLAARIELLLFEGSLVGGLCCRGDAGMTLRVFESFYNMLTHNSELLESREAIWIRPIYRNSNDYLNLKK